MAFQLERIFFYTFGSQNCLSMLATKGADNSGDLREVLQQCFETYGSVIDTDKNVHRFMSNVESRHRDQSSSGRYRPWNEKPTCAKCGKIGHKTSDCWSTNGSSWKSQKE